MYFQPFIGYNPPISYWLAAHKEPPILIRRISFVSQGADPQVVLWTVGGSVVARYGLIAPIQD